MKRNVPNMDSNSDRSKRPSLSPTKHFSTLPLASPYTYIHTPTPPASYWQEKPFRSSPEKPHDDEREETPSCITREVQITLPPSSPESDDPEHIVAADVVEEPEQIEDIDMATALGTSPGDSRRSNVISPRPKGRENSKNTLCRNINIYGHCRYENEGCAFNHDQNSLKTNPSQSMENRLVLSMLLSNRVVAHELF
jgi:hypothetical protein